MSIEIKSYTYEQVPRALLDELNGWYQRLILGDGEYSFVEAWAPPDYQLVLYDGPQWISSVEIIRQGVTVGGRPVDLAAISGVVTHPDHQGQGHGSRLLRYAVDFIAETCPVSFGALVCKTSLIPFYAGLGWQQVPGAISFPQPAGPGGFDPARVHLMIYPFTGAPWPGGDVVLSGLPW